MFTQGRTILVAALVLAALGAGPAMAKPGGAGPGATAAIELLDGRVTTIETVTPGGVTDCANGQVAKSGGSNNWACADDDDTTAIDWDDLFNLPTGFDDDTDDDTLGGLTICDNNEIAKWDGDSWECAGDEIGTDADTLGALNGCGTNEIAKWDGDSWECAADATGGGGGGTSFVLVDSDGGVGLGTEFGEILGIGRSGNEVHVTVLLINADFSTDPLISGTGVALRLENGLFAGQGEVFFEGGSCTGPAFVREDNGALDAIAPSAVLDEGGTVRRLYVATALTPVVRTSASSFVRTNSCVDPDVFTVSMVPAASVVTDLHVAMGDFIAPIVLQVVP